MVRKGASTAPMTGMIPNSPSEAPTGPRHREGRLVVWNDLSQLALPCGLGCVHTVTVVGRKVLGPVVSTREYDNGYTRVRTEVRKDAQGRFYHQRTQVDYCASPTWVRDEDNKRFTRLPPRLHDQPTVLLGDPLLTTAARHRKRHDLDSDT